MVRKRLSTLLAISFLCLILGLIASSARTAAPAPPVALASVSTAPAQQPSPCVLLGDFDGNGAVDVADIQQVASRWRCKCGDS